MENEGITVIISLWSDFSSVWLCNSKGSDNVSSNLLCGITVCDRTHALGVPWCPRWTHGSCSLCSPLGCPSLPYLGFGRLPQGPRVVSFHCKLATQVISCGPSAPINVLGNKACFAFMASSWPCSHSHASDVTPDFLTPACTGFGLLSPCLLVTLAADS